MNYNVADVLNLAKATMKVHGFNVSQTMDAIRSIQGVTEEEFDLIERALIEIRFQELGMTNKDILVLAIANGYWYKSVTSDDPLDKNDTLYDENIGRVKVTNLFAVVFDILDC